MFSAFAELDVEVVAGAVATLSPGFLIFYFRSRFITGRRPSASTIVFELVVISAIYYASIGATFFHFSWTGYFGGLMLFFLIPICLGVCFGVLVQRKLFDRVLEKLHLNPVHPASTAWDFMFGTMSEGKWVVVSLIDGRKIHGFFDRSSGASSDLTHRDLYISDARSEDFSRLDGANRRRGIWIREDQITTIELISD